MFLKNCLLLAALMICLGQAHAQTPTQGIYIGWERGGDLTPDVKGDAFYHLHELSIRGKDLVIKISPIFIEKGEMTYSASDGGFFTYKGKITRKGSKFQVKMQITDSDYSGVPSGGWPKLDVPLKVTSEVQLSLNGISYTLRERIPTE